MGLFDSFEIDKKGDIPIWVQLKQRLFYVITSGKLKPGDKLPTVRELAIQLDINYHTVNKVYHDLENSGLIEVHVGRGTFVSERVGSSFVALENDTRLAAAECASKLLRLGMTPEEVVQTIADHVHVPIAIRSADAGDNAASVERIRQKVPYVG